MNIVKSRVRGMPITMKNWGKARKVRELFKENIELAEEIENKIRAQAGILQGVMVEEGTNEEVAEADLNPEDDNITSQTTAPLGDNPPIPEKE